MGGRRVCCARGSLQNGQVIMLDVGDCAIRLAVQTWRHGAGGRNRCTRPAHAHRSGMKANTALGAFKCRKLIGICRVL